MVDEIEFNKRIENVFIKEEYFKDIIIEYFNLYCLQVFGRIYDYNIFNIKVFLFDLFNVEEKNGSFLLKTKEEVDETNINYGYISCLNPTKVTNIKDFADYIEQQLNYE